jgi:hypothetical protein
MYHVSWGVPIEGGFEKDENFMALRQSIIHVALGI